MANDGRPNVNPNDQLVRIIKARSPGLTHEQVAALELEWWSLYGKGFGQLADIAAEAVVPLRDVGPAAAIDHILNRLGAALLRGAVHRVLVVFEQELHERLMGFTTGDVGRDEVYAMLVDFMKLGRREVVPLEL